MNLSISLHDKRITLFVLLLGLSGSLGCLGPDDDPPPPPANRPPEITEFTIPRAVPRSTPTTPQVVRLTAVVNDQDGDPVSVFWEITRDGKPSGVLDPDQQGKPSIDWQTPTETGQDKITVTAWDGKASTVLEKTVQIGTLKTLHIRTASETWSVADSPFIVRPPARDFVIDGGMKLTVEAGSELLIDTKGLVISVVGILDVGGTAEAPVYIRPNAREADPGDWQGITASPSGPPPVVRLRHAYVWHAADAVKATISAIVHLDGCRISRARDSAVLHESSGDLRVENCIIMDNSNFGIKIRKLADPMPGGIFILGNRFTLNGDWTGGTAHVEQAAIYISILDKNAASTIIISGNQISGNGTPGIRLASFCSPKINDNAIHANEMNKTGARYDIVLAKGFGTGGTESTIDATMNFWGGPFPPETGEAEIKKTIRDAEDDTDIGAVVLVVPWRDTMP